VQHDDWELEESSRVFQFLQVIQRLTFVPFAYLHPKRFSLYSFQFDTDGQSIDCYFRQTMRIVDSMACLFHQCDRSHSKSGNFALFRTNQLVRIMILLPHALFKCTGDRINPILDIMCWN
jgi:hypothetical protein